jgi:hypothetical protein
MLRLRGGERSTSISRSCDMRMWWMDTDPAITIRVYAHAMRENEADHSSVEFGVPGQPMSKANRVRTNATLRTIWRARHDSLAGLRPSCFVLS